MRVLGIDPGLTRCGVGLVDAAPGRRVALVHVEVIRTPATADVAARLHTLHKRISVLVESHRPDVMTVERVFAHHNVRTAMGTAQAAGVAMVVASLHGVPVAMHTPSEVKAAVTGDGRAGKEQVAAMVRRLLGLNETPRPADASDALALAICHAWRTPLQQRLSGVGA